MSELEIIAAPYHLGVEGVGVGGGPAHLLEAGFAPPARIVRVSRQVDSTNELEAVADVNRQIRAGVADALARGELPVVLSGNCNSCLGTLAALAGRRTGIVWLDAHGDFRLPETSISGFLDGMALAASVGHCHRELAASIGFHTPVAEENVLLLGFRDLEEAEKTRFAASKVVCRSAAELADVNRLLDELATCVDAVYLHLDVDFLDATESPGVNFRGPGGLSVSAGAALVTEIRARLPLGAVAVTNYNPSHDPENRTQQAALRLIAAAMGRSQP